MPASAELANPLLDGNLLPRQSFTRFAENCRHVANTFGQNFLLLTYRRSDGYEEQINVQELEKPRTGTYRARIKGDDRVAEAEFTAAADTTAHNRANFLDRSYQELIETLEHKYAIRAQENLDLETRLGEERKLRFQAEDAMRLAQRRAAELEAQLEEADDQVLDDSLIELIRGVFGDFTGWLERTEAARTALDVIEAHPEVATALQEQVPEVILLLAHAAGEHTGDDEDADASAEAGLQ
ncbi:hypothetical protein [Polyangium mundeleinium]|uniref:Uncharacterized protein n=1 Tax=Polyangium mundeleinium TaxID=2995306 RepID=A0ABT5EEE3_9BACT|nr:hypothetical protein [Polyangium mundeleinium]MDC0740136.1 hypothetical protein [Polyangium mundeleinium]MDC0746682.1 hypothetical protein [Polyangium mundeleinium]